MSQQVNDTCEMASTVEDQEVQMQNLLDAVSQLCACLRVAEWLSCHHIKRTRDRIGTGSSVVGFRQVLKSRCLFLAWKQATLGFCGFDLKKKIVNSYVSIQRSDQMVLESGEMNSSSQTTAGKVRRRHGQVQPARKELPLFQRKNPIWRFFCFVLQF